MSESRAGDAAQLLGKVPGRDAGVDAQTDDDIAHYPPLAVHAGLGQNAADLSLVEVNVIDPLDLGLPAGELLDGLGRGHRGAGGQARGLCGAQGRAEQQAHIQAAPGGRVKAPTHPAPAGGLFLGHKDQPGGGALGGETF